MKSQALYSMEWILKIYFPASVAKTQQLSEANYHIKKWMA